MFDVRGFFGAFGGEEAVELAVFFFELHVAADPGEDLAVLGEDGVDDVAAEAPGSFVAAAVVGEVAATPFFHRLGRKSGMLADVGRGGGGHGGDVGDELGVDVVQFANAFVGGFDQGDVAWRFFLGRGLDSVGRGLFLLSGLRGWLGGRGRTSCG